MAERKPQTNSELIIRSSRPSNNRTILIHISFRRRCLSRDGPCTMYNHIYTCPWVKYLCQIRRTKRVGGRGVDSNLYKDTWPKGFLKLYLWNSIKKVDWWRQWVDLKLMKDLPILIRSNALWLVFMILNGYDGNWMSHIDRKRDYESFSRSKWNPEDLDFL